jgi:hypothetical protein
VAPDLVVRVAGTADAGAIAQLRSLWSEADPDPAFVVPDDAAGDHRLLVRPG